MACHLAQAGLPSAGPMEIQDCLTENIKLNKVGAVLESSEQVWREDGSKRQYHAISR